MLGQVPLVLYNVRCLVYRELYPRSSWCTLRGCVKNVLTGKIILTTNRDGVKICKVLVLPSNGCNEYLYIIFVQLSENNEYIFF